jgi:hypothetical protein
MFKFYDKVREFVDECHQPGGSIDMERHRAVSFQHLERTVYWVTQLKPDADEALLIAAITHDIERALTEVPEYKASNVKAGGFTTTDFLREHQDTSARIVAEYLESQHAPIEMIDRVVALVSKHEEGGDDDQNLLKDADSLSHFEISAPYFLSTIINEVGDEKVRAKFDWMYDRITSEQARQIAKPFYEEALLTLERFQMQ